MVKTFFNGHYGQTLSQKVEDKKVIPKRNFHAFLFGALTLGALAYFSYRKEPRRIKKYF